MPPGGDEHHEPLSVEDARILALEEGPVRGHTCKVVLLEGAVGADELRGRFAERIAREPRLSLRLVAGDEPAWEPDPDVDLTDQVRVAAGVDAAGLPTVIGLLMAERLPRDRPLWALDVVAVEDGRIALVWRIHHALADGMTAMRMVRHVLLDVPEPGAASVSPDATRAAAAPAGGGPSAAPGTAAVSRLAPLRAALRVPETLYRELARRGADTVLDCDIGERREVAFVDVSLDEAKRIAHALPERATVNDVVLTAVAGGLRRWLDSLDAHPSALRAMVPVSLHHPGDEAGNRDSFILVDLPLDEPDPVARLGAVAYETRARKRDHDAQTLDAFFRDLTHLSGSLERFAEQWTASPRVFALNVSNVPGPTGPLSVLGVPVASLHSLAEIGHRHALRVAVVSAGGRIGFGLCADADALGSPQPIADGIAADLRALDAALG